MRIQFRISHPSLNFKGFGVTKCIFRSLYYVSGDYNITVPGVCFSSLQWIHSEGRWRSRWRCPLELMVLDAEIRHVLFISLGKLKQLLNQCQFILIFTRMEIVYWVKWKYTNMCALTCQRKKRQSVTSMGASHTALKYTTKSISFWVSAETRLTISPTVHVLRAALFTTRDWG